jgi:START domain-containing protein
MEQKKSAGFATRRGVVGAACLLVALLPLAFARAESWETVFDADGLLVERRPYAGSALQEIRGVIRLQTSLNAVMALLKDAEFNQQWVYRSGGARVLEEDGYAKAYVYGIVDAPWPMQDRDTVVRFDYRQEAGGDITISITNFPDYLPHAEDYVRVPDFGGHWRLRPQQDGQVEVTYQVYGDPGGWIPVWVANFAAVTSVTRTLQAMDSAVRNYTNANSEFVRELGGNDS